MTTADAILSTLRSENVADSNMEMANVVDTLDDLSRAASRIAAAITPNILGGKDDTGGHVESLTEAVMGVTSGLCRIADAIESLASAVESVAAAKE